MNSTTSVRDVCRAASVKGGVDVLRALQRTNDFNTILKITDLDRGVVYRAIERWVKLGIVKDEFDYEHKKHRYFLTPLGKVILLKLEEIERLLNIPSFKKSAEEIVEYLDSLPKEEQEKRLLSKSVNEEELI